MFPIADNWTFLIDESLSPNVAGALKHVGYNTITVIEAFGSFGIDDLRIIRWCGEQEIVWIYADDRARKQHKKHLVAANIRTLWVSRPKAGMNTKEQLRLLAFTLPNLVDKYNNDPKVFHYKSWAHGQPARPTIQLKPSPLP